MEYFNKRCSIPTLCPPFDGAINHAISVSNFDSNTLILDSFGNVWVCGYGILGNGKDNGFIKVPQKLDVQQKVIDVSVGDSHALLLSIDGRVQSFGASEHGALGHGDFRTSLVPKTIESLKAHTITQISCGCQHFAALTNNGELFMCGINDFGQCGQSAKNVKMIDTPTKLEFDKKVLLIECGNDHNLLITEEHLMYSFGDDYRGALGRLNCDNHRPMLIEGLSKKKINKCAAGRQHSLCIDEKGIVWSFGCNNYGQLGLGHKLNQNTPKIIKWFVSNGIKAKECAAGVYQSAIICQDWNLYVFGGNVCTPNKIPYLQVEKVSMGYEYIGSMNTLCYP